MRAAIFILVVILVILMGAGSGIDYNQKKAQWFKECEQHQPHYQCEVLWRTD